MKSSLVKTIKRHLNSQNGRNTLTFLVFLSISTLFWFVMTLNDEVQRNYEVKVNINGLPADITLLSPHGENPTVNVSIKDKGVNQLAKKFTGNVSLRFNFRELLRKDNRIIVSEALLSTAIHQLFGPAAEIISQSPDSLSINYTTLPPTKIPIVTKIKATTAPGFTIPGPAKMSVDSVLVFSAQPLGNSLKAIETEPISLQNIKDTTVVTVKTVSPAYCRTEPDEIKISIPVEPLVNKHFDIIVEPINVPADIAMTTFPATVQFSCLIPMSRYNDAPYPIKAYADWEKRKDKTISLEMSLVPDFYINGSLSPEYVEYILETKETE